MKLTKVFLKLILLIPGVLILSALALILWPIAFFFWLYEDDGMPMQLFYVISGQAAWVVALVYLSLTHFN